MNNSCDIVSARELDPMRIPPAGGTLCWPAGLDEKTPALLERMFRDPRVLEPADRGELIQQLRQAVEIAPHVPEIRVLLGMTLCVDLQAQTALEELRQAAKMAPDCFIARLKFGEILMRLRICDQAEVETKAAAKLAANAYQSDLARKQAAQIRSMMREGIERGGYNGIVSKFFHFPRKSRTRSISPSILTSE